MNRAPESSWRQSFAGAGLLIGCLVSWSPVAAQSLADRVLAVTNGQVRMSFAARPGVCGSGRSISTRHDTDDWESWCEQGPVRVAIDLADGEVIDVDTYVGGRWRPPGSRTTDLGTVSAADAARYLLSIARQSTSRAGKAAVLPAALADSIVVWHDLLALAKDELRPRQTRKAAVFWVAQAAGEVATAGLEEIVDDESGDREVRKSAVFALSQVKGDAGVTSLIRLVRTHPDPVIKKQAIFWLGQSEDPRAMALFEELLVRR